MATRGLTTQTVQAKVRQPKSYTSLQMEQKLNRKTQRTIKVNQYRSRDQSNQKPQEQKSHEEILSVHIDDTQKSTYTAKVGSTEATALFDSGAMLSCISKQFYNHISCTEPLKVIDTNAEPAIIVTSASLDKLINLG